MNFNDVMTYHGVWVPVESMVIYRECVYCALICWWIELILHG